MDAVVLALALATLLAVFWPTWRSMVQTWQDSETFRHGFLVPLAFAVLAWRDRARIAAQPRRVEWKALVLLGLAGLAWLAAEVVGVNAVRQYAVVAMVPLLVLLLMGRHVFRALLFPFAFLFFMVPAGEFMLPTMIGWTADFTVWAVRASGVPVFREGTMFTLPSGRWSVVEACSGLRYLVAALPLATLYAYLSFGSNRVRAAFVLLTLVVALAANWLRAWGIVMLGHWSDMKIATGVDHLVYGWLFFGIVMGIVFWIGARWQARTAGPSDPRDPSLRARADAARFAPSQRPAPLVAAALSALLVVGAWPPAADALASGSGEVLDLEQAARHLLAPGTRGDFVPAYTRAAHVATGTVRDAPDVRAWVGQYWDQRNRGEMIGYPNAVVAAESDAWHIVATRVVPLTVAPGQATEFALAAQDGRRLIAWRWHLVDGRVVLDPYRAKVDTALGLLQGRGDESFAVFVWTESDERDPQRPRARLAEAAAALQRALDRPEAAR